MVTPFARAVEMLAPGASCRELAKRFRTAPISISRWRRGLRKPPQAIIDMIQAAIAADARKRLEASYGLQAGIPKQTIGARALRAYNARRAKEKAALASGQFPTGKSDD